MQSYEHHVVHESLEMRHPYMQDEDIFTGDINPDQVSPPDTHASHFLSLQFRSPQLSLTACSLNLKKCS